MFLTRPETDTTRRRRWSLKTAVAGLGAMMLTGAGLALLPTTAAAAADIPALQQVLDDAKKAEAAAKQTFDTAQLAVTNATTAVATATTTAASAQAASDAAPSDKALKDAAKEANKALKTAEGVLRAAEKDLAKADKALTDAQAAVTTAQQNLDAGIAQNNAPPVVTPGNEEPKNEGPENEGPKNEEPTNEGPKEEEPKEGKDKWDGKCGPRDEAPALDAGSVQAFGDGWYNDCYKAPVIEIDVDYCPVVVTVTISNLKHWLEYKVKINGEWVDFEIVDGTATIELPDFEDDKVHVVVKYDKKWHESDRSWNEGKKWGHGGKVEAHEKVEDKDCYKEPVIDINVDYCPVVVTVTISNLKHWLDYKVKINGDYYEVDDSKESHTIELKDFEGDEVHVVVKYHKAGTEWAHGGKVKAHEKIEDKNCSKEPVIDVEVIDWCPTEVEVTISNLKHWLHYKVKINGEKYTLEDYEDGTATIVLDDFGHGKLHVVVKYFKKGEHHVYGGKVELVEHIKKKHCGDYEGCERPHDGDRALSATEAETLGKHWEKDCYTRPDIDIDVVNWCPTVIEVEIDNLKRWLDYKVKVNGEWVDIDIENGSATIEVTDFDHGKLEVVVKYSKKWHNDHKKWDHHKKWGHGGKVYEKEYIDEYDCPEIDHEVEQVCNKIDGKTEVEIQVTGLDEDRKYLVTVEGDDYKKHFWVKYEESFYKDVKLREGNYTVTVESWAHKGGDHGGDMSVQGGGGHHYDHADVGPVVYDFTVSGCPVDVVVEPTEDCKSIKAVLDTLVEGRKYIVKVKDSEGDVVFEKTVWGPTTIDQKFHQDTYKVIVIDVKARDHGDHHGGWGGWDGHDNGHYNPWKDHDKDVVLTAVVGDEYAYDRDRGKGGWHGDDDHHGDWDNDHHGDWDNDHGKKGKRLKWTATITLSDCPEPPVVVEPAGETPDHSSGGHNNGGSWTPSVGGSGGGVLATTGADPAGLALAALILLPAGGAIVASRSVIARRKNAA